MSSFFLEDGILGILSGANFCLLGFRLTQPLPVQPSPPQAQIQCLNCIFPCHAFLRRILVPIPWNITSFLVEMLVTSFFLEEYGRFCWKSLEIKLTWCHESHQAKTDPDKQTNTFTTKDGERSEDTVQPSSAQKWMNWGQDCQTWSFSLFWQNLDKVVWKVQIPQERDMRMEMPGVMWISQFFHVFIFFDFSTFQKTSKHIVISWHMIYHFFPGPFCC